MALNDYLAEEVALDLADGLLTRREALRRLGLFGFSVAGATALLAGCGDGAEEGTAGASGSTPASPTVSDAPTTSAAPAAGAPAETIRFPGPAGELQAAWAAPADPTAGLLVIHENRGRTPHFDDLVSRFAGEGYAAMSVDLLSRQGGTAALADEAAVQAALAAAPVEQLIADLRAGIDELGRRVPDKKVGAVGFCFGGAMTWNLLDVGESRLAAAAPFYGPAPEAPDFAGVQAAVLAIYAELDARVNASRERAEAALKRAGLVYDIRTFAGADHAFFNDTSPRYNETAAREAYSVLLAWFDQYLR
jgi:carboxymethylenebutenolidase